MRNKIFINLNENNIIYNREDNISFNRTKIYEYDNYGNILTINEYSYTTSDTLGDPIYVCPYVYHDRFD